MKKILFISFALVLMIAAGVVVWKFLSGDDLSFGEKVEIDAEFGIEDGDTVQDPLEAEQRMQDTNKEEAGFLNDRPVQITKGVKHTVPLKEIRGGGPEKDGIPSIDNPKFVSIDNANFISDEEPGIAVSKNGIDRFYPFQVMVWHEIVNDVFGEDRVLVTYCPLCFSGIVFDPLVQGERVEFGTSGKLWQSNLVMYDRKTDSYWSQVLGEAIRGPLAGEKLLVLPSDMTKFGVWKKKHPTGEVLSKDTGIQRLYGYDPYGSQGYYTDHDQIIVPVSRKDDRLPNKTLILGVVIDGQAKAYNPASIKKVGEYVDDFAGKKLVVRYVEDEDVVRVFERSASGSLTRLQPFPSYWFAWGAAHPNTDVYE